jgi:hypothetical protein
MSETPTTDRAHEETNQMTQNAQADREARILTTGTGQAETTSTARDVATGVADLQADIERNRRDLARTVDHLAAKLDVKTRVRNRVTEASADATRQLRTLRHRTAELRSNADTGSIAIGTGVLAAATAILVVTLWRRNQTSRRWGRR